MPEVAEKKKGYAEIKRTQVLAKKRKASRIERTKRKVSQRARRSKRSK